MNGTLLLNGIVLVLLCVPIAIQLLFPPCGIEGDPATGHLKH